MKLNAVSSLRKFKNKLNYFIWFSTNTLHNILRHCFFFVKYIDNILILHLRVQICLPQYTDNII